MPEAVPAAAAMDGPQYMRQSYLRVYLQDALALLLMEQPEDPLEFFAAYFEKVRSGDNVANRPFKYINATSRNRLAFVQLYKRTYANLFQRTDLTFMDFLELQRMLCHDFPVQFCEDVAKCLTTTGYPSNALRFESFVSMFQLLFYYSEFMMHAGECYRQCMVVATEPQSTESQGEGESAHHASNAPKVVYSLAYLRAMRTYAPLAHCSMAQSSSSESEYGAEHITNAPFASPSQAVIDAAIKEFTEAHREETDATEGVYDFQGAPITFNDVCVLLAQRKEIAQVFQSRSWPGRRGSDSLWRAGSMGSRGAGSGASIGSDPLAGLGQFHGSIGSDIGGYGFGDGSSSLNLGFGRSPINNPVSLAVDVNSKTRRKGPPKAKRKSKSKKKLSGGDKPSSGQAL